jgi:carbamoyl-phosphate synthase large subunit
MGAPILKPSMIPVVPDAFGKGILTEHTDLWGEVIREAEIPLRDAFSLKGTCVSMGNPHCVVQVADVAGFDVSGIGPLFEHNPAFPEGVNTEFIHVDDRTNVTMRVWERGNGETLACGTGACAAVVAAVENGFCQKGEDITVKLRGGDLIVNYTDDEVILTGNAELIYNGEVEN